MNKTAIRNYAIWARNKLIADVSYRAGLMGITKDGISDALPQSTTDVEFYDIGTAEPYSIHNGEIKQRKSLVELIRQKEKDSDYITAYTSVIEEVAYTWFNRLIAVRFMEVNDYMPAHIRVLSSETGKLEPDIVTTPFDAELELTDAEKQLIIQLKNDNKLDDCFRMLFIKQCNALYELLPRLFENTKDYTELLLNVSFVDQEGVVFRLVHDIEEDDFNIEKGGQVEIIGWLYQYYNDEKKNEVININKSSIRKEDIPAATQLFTTDWVVRYIVDNSLGKFWIERHPQSGLRDSLEYLIIPKVGAVDSVQDEISPEQIKVFDPCMGSGHFLVYAFDLLMKIYEESGYTQRDAARSIVENNIYGLDIDDRAAQIAYFAVMMKARQYNRRIIDGQTKCKVMSVVESNGFDYSCLVKIGDLRKTAEKLLNDFKDAKEYGTIIQISTTSAELDELEDRLLSLDKFADYGNLVDMLYTDQLCNGLMPLIEQARIMLNKYHVVDTNPPYLNKYNPKLRKYVTENYKDYSGDLFSIFIYRNLLFCGEKGYAGFMTPFVWMFLLSYEKLRQYIIDNKTLSSMIQFEYSAFEEATVPICSFVIQNGKTNKKGTYIRLSDFRGGMNVQRDKVVEAIKDNECKYYYEVEQKRFNAIPSAPIAYWISDNLVSAFERGTRMGDISKPRQGMATTNNNLFLRLWYEINNEKMCVGAKNAKEAEDSGKKWFPYNKGGEFRRWYGNNDFMVDWENNGRRVKDYLIGKNPNIPRGESLFFKRCFSWSLISSGKPAFRYKDYGNIFDIAGMSCFSDDDLEYLLAFCNSKISIILLSVLAPTINFQAGDIANMPVLEAGDNKEAIEGIVNQNIRISKNDWDSFETSWDFKKHPLI